MQDLKRDIGNELEGQDWSLKIDPNEPATLIFAYPYALEDEAYAGTPYIRPLIRLEFGGRNEVWPTEDGAVRSYCAESHPDLVSDHDAMTRVLRPDRTFWEKATLVHAEYFRPQDKSPGERLSRHYYDLVMLDRASVAAVALKENELRDAVVAHKSVFPLQHGHGMTWRRLEHFELSLTHHWKGPSDWTTG